MYLEWFKFAFAAHASFKKLCCLWLLTCDKTQVFFIKLIFIILAQAKGRGILNGYEREILILKIERKFTQVFVIKARKRKAEKWSGKNK